MRGLPARRTGGEVVCTAEGECPARAGFGCALSPKSAMLPRGKGMSGAGALDLVQRKWSRGLRAPLRFAGGQGVPSEGLGLDREACAPVDLQRTSRTQVAKAQPCYLGHTSHLQLSVARCGRGSPGGEGWAAPWVQAQRPGRGWGRASGVSKQCL